MGGPASSNRLNHHSLRMAHRQYYLLNNYKSFPFGIEVKFYMEGKINKWLEDENNQFKDIILHSKKSKMEKIVEKEFNKNIFGILILNLENVLSLQNHQIFHNADAPMSNGCYYNTVKQIL